MLKYKLPLIAAIIAIAITTTMDFTGYSTFSALPLLGITIVFWLVLRLSKVEIGFNLVLLNIMAMRFFILR